MQQLYPWSCLTASFAYCMGVREDEIHRSIGHDGSKIIASDLPPPKDRLAFHPQELVEWCLRNGTRVVHFLANPGYALENGMEYTLWSNEECVTRLEKVMKHYSGVLCGKMRSGKMHAVVWDCRHQLLIDPNGFHYPKDHIQVTDFFLIQYGGFSFCEICQGRCRA